MTERPYGKWEYSREVVDTLIRVIRERCGGFSEWWDDHTPSRQAEYHDAWTYAVCKIPQPPAGEVEK